MAGVGRRGRGSRPRSTARVAGQEVDDLLGVVAVPVHPHRQRLEAAQGQPGVERPGDRAHGVLVEADLLGQVEVARRPARRRRRRSGRRSTWWSSARRRRRRGSAAAAGTARRRCCRRPAAHPRRGRCSASAAMSAMLSSGLVGVSTQTSLVCRGGSRPRTASRSRERRGAVRQPPALLDLVEEPVRAAVRVVGDHDVVAGPAERADQRVLGGQAGGEREARAPPPPAPRCCPRGRCGSGWRSGCTRSRRAGRRRRPACRSTGRVDRRDHRAGRRVRLVARVDRARLEALPLG